MVDLYGYTSVAVAAVQDQARELEALRAEVQTLRELVTKLAAAKGCAAP